MPEKSGLLHGTIAITLPLVFYVIVSPWVLCDVIDDLTIIYIDLTINLIIIYIDALVYC